MTADTLHLAQQALASKTYLGFVIVAVMFLARASKDDVPWFLSLPPSVRAWAALLLGFAVEALSVTAAGWDAGGAVQMGLVAGAAPILGHELIIKGLVAMGVLKSGDVPMPGATRTGSD